MKTVIIPNGDSDGLMVIHSGGVDGTANNEWG